MATSETLRSVIEAGRTSRRLDELSAARVIGKVAQQVHAAQQKAGAGKAVGPISPAAVALAESGQTTLTLPSGSALGYSAPEQAAGSAGDRRSDVFSLGVVMWEALTHQRLFEAMNDAAVKAAIAEREIKPPAEVNANVPAELSAICMRALARGSADRYQSAKSMAVEIEEFLDEAGYPDSDEQIATFLAQLGTARPEKKVTLPPSAHDKAPAVSNATAQGGLPAVMKPPASMPAASAQATVAAPADKTSTSPGLGPSVLVAPAPAVNARTANGTAPPPQVPLPPVLPGSTIATGGKPEPAKAVTETNGSATKSAKPEADTNGDPAKTLLERPAKPNLPGVSPAQTVLGIPPAPDVPIASAAPASIATPTSAIAAPPAPPLPASTAAPTMPLVPVAPPPPVATQPAVPPKPPVVPPPSAAPSAPMAASDSTPNPAGVVALPGRESKDVLAGWGWGTDAHQAIDEDDLDDRAGANSKKLLMYLIGGGVVFAAMVAIIAFGFGGSKKKHAPPPVAAAQEGSAAAALPGAGSGAGPAAGSSDTGAAIAAASPGSAADVAGTAGSAVEPTGSAVPETATTGAPGSATTATAEVGSAAGTGAAQVAATGPINPYPDTTNTAKPDTKPAVPDKVGKVETKPEPKPRPETKPSKPKPERPKEVVKTRPDTRTSKPDRSREIAKATKPDKQEQKGDAEASYKAGIMQFARGDTTGALASLRTSLAANPSYAPTWRGLGLVFEKLGEKDQARAAYKRYLQLAPGAGDSDQIHNRMERLGS